MKQACTVLLATIIGFPALANDSTAVLEAGGLRLVRDAPVELLQEDLTISASQIEVSYVFRAADDEGTTSIVAFPLPEYDLAWHGYSVLGGPGDTVQDRGDFRIWVDDREIEPQIEVKALRNGIDVTEVLVDAGIPPETLDFDRLTKGIANLPADLRQQLVRADLVEHYDGEEYMPEWTVKATYYWLQDFPAGQMVNVRHSYEPIAGLFFIADPELRDFNPQDFCMSSGEKQGVRDRLAGSGYGAIMGAEVRYILTTGANWSGPIQTFNLVIDKEAPEALVSLCFDGLRKVTSTRFEATRHNYTPTQDLQVLFVSIPE